MKSVMKNKVMVETGWSLPGSPGEED